MKGAAKWALAALGCGLTAACVSPDMTVCGDLVCGVTQRCAPAGDRCVDEEEFSACLGLDEAAACALDGVPGICRAGLCTIVRCGNGAVDPGERCDDGNTISADGCNATCTSDESCGNGVIELVEACDCGDGSTPAGVACGETINGGAICDEGCRLRGCGNARVDPGERCDDGNLLPGDGCAADCASTETCGNGIIDYAVGELCDCGDGNGVDVPSACLAPNQPPAMATPGACRAPSSGGPPGCQRASCGNGIVEAGEACDDGNFAFDDACLPTCEVPSCGDGFRAVSEACDDGNLIDDDACTAACAVATCGDGILRVGVEACDDGNAFSGDGCQKNCQLPFCGDGDLDASQGEACDAGNLNVAGPAPLGACRVGCTRQACGDLIVDVAAGEQCDVGENDDGQCNGTSAAVVGVACLEPRCGDGHANLATGERCDAGDANTNEPRVALVCRLNCTVKRCGDGIADPDEGCDDGSDSETCDADCTPAGCGDGYTNPEAGESCDGGDGCYACQPWCGDEIIAGGEACDDGAETASCDPDCTLVTCGDDYVNGTAGESCEGTDGCVDCQPACGNGQLDGSEACDDAGDSPTCDRDCTAASCGDLYVNARAGESCDPPDASCRATCNFCGDGVFDTEPPGAEECDTAGETAACDPDCTLPACGDGVLNGAADEACDDGNSDDDGNGCGGDCRRSGFCGDLVLQSLFEACDDGSGGSGACDDDCTEARCGDGLRNGLAGEACDDGNNDAGDGCDTSCQVEA